ncbi:helix-turn-helix transcriptional regulator [Clostridium estertheticum]|uniref:helix-turn-helix domain-containing protein n=1 Tax=Clostridium estertheticum TaxID=238834 RepID=UPI001C0B60B9|nr:helix-turn-helix transcriptional regulator [Clostridium estertheticum]MBU3176056.1 helix-turn-helix transcriptional regulator [Clostridium estertheticum]
MDIGSKIKQFRNEQGLTQKQLAAKSTISRSYLGDVEKNRYHASVETLKKIAEALGLPITKLLTTEEQLEIATGSLNEVNETISNYYLSKTDKIYSRELQLDAEDNLLMNKIKNLSEKNRKIVEVLVNQLEND